MRGLVIWGGILLGVVGSLAAAEERPAAWHRPYTGEEATGTHVLGLWHLDGPTAAGGLPVALRGRARFVAEGRFGGALESFAVVKDEAGAKGAEGGAVRSEPSLAPAGAFTVEMWIKPKPDLAGSKTAFLLDKKYFHYAKDIPRANQGYCLYLTPSSGGRFVLNVSLGFGTDSAWYRSSPLDFPAGEWRHVAFTYDGAGTVRLFVNGECVGRGTSEGKGAVAPSKYPLVLGDRVGSTHSGFAGFIDEVRISSGVQPAFAGDLTFVLGTGRTVFRRGEQGGRLEAQVVNDTGVALTGLSGQATLVGQSVPLRTDELAAGGAMPVALPVNTLLRPDIYTLEIRLSGRDEQGREHAMSEDVPITIVARPPPNQMPVVMWGSGDVERLRDIGFTHDLRHMADYGMIWRDGDGQACPSVRAETVARTLDTYLAQGLGGVVYLYPGRWVERNKELSHLHRVDRDGKPYSRGNTSASAPEVQRFAYNVGAAVARTFGRFPALSASLVHSEIRDGTDISHHGFEREQCREALGFDIPREATSKRGVQYSALPGFPKDRVIDDENRLLRFYRWFWREGDGWNPLHTKVGDGLHATGRDDIWTFFDPAVRAPSIWGSGGKVNVVSQWTYSYPDPIKVGEAADELFAMADGTPGQQVMKMTQIIWYRSQTAPKGEASGKAEWETRLPDAKFITIAPDHMREAIWSMLARPIRGIMFHGWGSLVESPHGSYRYTNPRTRDVLTELVRKVVRPLGPTLLQVPDRPADVALLQSFSSQMFAGRGSYGWSRSWEADMHLVLQWAGLQPRIIYEEHILRDGLAPYKVLVMPHCDVLPRSVADAVLAFQRRGGLIVGDEALCPAITPDILLRSVRRDRDAAKGKEQMLAKARELRSELDPFYERYAASDNPEVVLRMRTTGTSDYLFAINDSRTFGDYVGHHRLVMENGLPASAHLTVRRPAGAVYDLVRHELVPSTVENGQLSLDLGFAPGQGRLLLILPEPIVGLSCNVPEEAKLGAEAELVFRVHGEGAMADTVIPLEISILDPRGRMAEGSGFYGAKGGRQVIRLQLAANDLAGAWTVRARELASGQEAEQRFAVLP